MGLDAVELVMAVDEKFDINITDEEASNALTVGHLKRLVLSKVALADTAGCLTQRAFHMIRKAAMAEFGVGRVGVRPDTPLDALVPQATRRESWMHFQSALGVADLPELVRPSSVSVPATVLVLSTIVIPVWYGALHSDYFGRALLFATVAGSAVGWASARLIAPMKTKFDEGYERVRDLARYLVARYPQAVGKPRAAKWTEEEVSCLLREIIMEQLGVRNFNDNSRFVQDLHID
jgi:hypothetical protein